MCTKRKTPKFCMKIYQYKETKPSNSHFLFYKLILCGLCIQTKHGCFMSIKSQCQKVPTFLWSEAGGLSLHAYGGCECAVSTQLQPHCLVPGTSCLAVNNPLYAQAVLPGSLAQPSHLEAPDTVVFIVCFPTLRMQALTRG